jgi:ATP-binding cassette, subfamily B, bacterial
MERSSALSASESLTNGQLILRLFGLSFRYRAACMRVLLYQVLLISMTLGGLGFVGLAIDYIHSQVAADAAAPRWPFGFSMPEHWTPLSIVAVLAFCVFLFAVVKGVLTYIYTVSVATLVQTDIVVNLRSEVFNKLQQLSFRFYDNNSSGSIINRVTGDVQNVRMFVDGVILPTVVLLIALGVYLTYMVSIHAWLTLACMATTPVLYVITVLFSKKVRPMYRRNRELIDALILRLAENIQGIAVVKGFGREKEQAEQFRASNQVVKDQQQNIFWRVSLYTPSVNFLTQVNLVVLLSYGGFLVVKGDLPLGAGLVVFAGILQQLSQQISSIATITNSVQQSLIGARRVFEVLDAPIDVASREDAVVLDQPQGRVTFERVGFQYLNEDPVLRDIQFEVMPGQRVAILGQTGSGKSLLLGLIPRFYDPRSGVVRLDGHDLRDLDVSSLRRSIGIVFQESFLFSTTVAANIAFGHPEATQEQIEQAARIAAAHEFIVNLPEGYNTVLGEAAVNLSGGQRQRLAIARAILLNPAVLILDDPTAAIDSKTEKEIMTSLEQAMRGRTTFIVAHRLSTLRQADLILVLDRGRIVQRGTHEQLMRQRGPYLRVARLQLLDAAQLMDETEVQAAEGDLS